jgi:hypothetical protein
MYIPIRDIIDIKRELWLITTCVKIAVKNGSLLKKTKAVLAVAQVPLKAINKVSFL